MKTVLVTGATGAIGQAVIARLRRDGRYRVVATSRHCDDVNGFRLDVRDREKFTSAINRTEPDLVLHLAGMFEGDFNDVYAVNVEAARYLLDAVQQSGYRTRVLLVGSAAEYGIVRPEENPIQEDRVLIPVSIYALTKAWQTQLAGLYACRGVDVVVARIFNVYGPCLSERLFVGRLQKQIEEVLAGRKSVIEIGPLSSIRDYVSTNEAADQLLAIATLAEPGRVCHVASGIPVTMRDMLDRYLAIHGLDASIVKEAVELSNHISYGISYGVEEIYANVTNTMQLMRIWRSGVEA